MNATSDAPGWLDWSAITTEPAHRALAAIVERFDIRTRWSGLDHDEDRVRRAVLVLYARLGHAPAAAEIAAEAGVPAGEIGAVLARLEARDILRLDAATGAMLGAYPFTGDESGHRVTLDGRGLNAMCSIDALGVGAMYGRDVTVESACRGCGAAIHVATGGDGTALARVSPPGALVWAALHYAEGCAATSMCPLTVFFCCDAHLTAWRKENPEVDGFALTMDEGVEVGRAIFGRRLAPASGAPSGGDV